MLTNAAERFNSSTHAEIARARRGPLAGMYGRSQADIAARFNVTTKTVRYLHGTLGDLLDIGAENGSPVTETFSRYYSFELARKRTLYRRTIYNPWHAKAGRQAR